MPRCKSLAKRDRNIDTILKRTHRDSIASNYLTCKSVHTFAAIGKCAKVEVPFRCQLSLWFGKEQLPDQNGFGRILRQGYWEKPASLASPIRLWPNNCLLGPVLPLTRP